MSALATTVHTLGAAAIANTREFSVVHPPAGMGMLALVALLPNTVAPASAGASASQSGKANTAQRRRPVPRRVVREPRSWWLRPSNDSVPFVMCMTLLLSIELNSRRFGPSSSRCPTKSYVSSQRSWPPLSRIHHLLSRLRRTRVEHLRLATLPSFLPAPTPGDPEQRV